MIFVSLKTPPQFWKDVKSYKWFMPRLFACLCAGIVIAMTVIFATFVIEFKSAWTCEHRSYIFACILMQILFMVRTFYSDRWFPLAVMGALRAQ